MKIKAVILIIVSLCAFNFGVFAQEKQKLSIIKGKRSKDKIENLDSIKHVADSLYKVLQYRDSLDIINSSIIDSLKQNAKRDSLRFIVAINHQRDSLSAIINVRDKEIKVLKDNTGFVDTCMVKLANRWLSEKYDKSDIDEAIKYFDRIYSSKLKSEFSIVQILLKEYEKSYKEFQSILKEAQSDYYREIPFDSDKYKNKYMSKIEGMEYYIKYYNSDWNIIYLKAKIGEAIEIIKNHSPNKFADFSHLIDYDL